ncbi:microtubule-associated protein futsch-like isoform X2 [Temnothorax curvispinosus]|uniref:Microtubule-associated protein futsch-like isoform X2 n=1 Tax=Temnothorax curvispinosus TaxID=300111 RepID=A0A6J1QJQ4_9HYME|nr:microtubule-associated protein futsch-like isoform X2 [Temnothorax curvispinosus]
MMASDLSSGCTDTIDILDDEKEEGEISLEDVSSSEEGGMGHLTSSYVVGRTRPCPDCKSWGECATWCNATYHPKNRRDPVKGKENRHHVRETGCAATKHVASTLQEKNDDDDLVPISSDSDMEIVGLTDTSNRAKAKVKKKKRKKRKYEPLTLDELLSPSSIDLSIAEVGALKIYREVSPAHRPSGRSKMITKSPVRRYRSPVVARASFQSSRSPVSHPRSPIQKRSLRNARSPKRSPRRHSPVRAAKRPPPKLSSPPFARSHVSERHDDVTRLLKKVKHLDSSITTHSSEPSVNRSKESSSLKEKLSNILKGAGIDDHAVQLKEKLKSETINDADDEEDLALLRQKALETKQKKSNGSSDHLTDVESENRSADDRVNDDQDEEALQLRMIALRSAVMKKHQNRVQRGIKAKRSTRSESPFSSSFLDDIPVPGDELLKYASPPCTPPCDSNHIEDMDLDTDVEREKEKLPYSPTDKIENISIDTALLGIEPSDVSFINVNETIGSPVFDDAQDELATNRVTPYYDGTYLPYQVPPATQYCSYSPSRYGSETYHSDLNNAVGKGPENLHGDDVVCDLIDGICCQEGTYSSTSIMSNTSHALPASESLLAPSVSPHDTLASSPQMQQIVEQPTNDGAPTTTVYAESMSPNESMITIDDLPENDADPLSSPNVALGDDRNLPATEYIPKEAAPCRAAAEEPLYMQGIPDITKETNKIPTLINRTLVPAPILRSNRQLRRQTRQDALLKKRETPISEPTFKSAEMQPVTITATDASSSVFKPIKLQVAKKSAPVLSASATFDDSMNESLDVLENQKDSPGKNHEASEPQHPETSVGTPSASSKAAPTRSKKRKRAKKNCRKSPDTAQLLEKEKSPCLDAGVNKNTDIVDASVPDRQTVTESDQSKSNDNADAQESSMGNGESLRLQSVTDTQEPVNSDDVLTKRRDKDKNNYTALSVRIEQSQEEQIESHCLSTNPAPDNSDSTSVSDKAINTMKSDSNRRQSIDEDEDELRAILLASLKRTKSTDISPSVIPVISVTSSAATNVQTPALKTLAGTMPSAANATSTASNNASSLPSRPLTSLETVKKKINDVPVSVQNGSRKRSSSLDTAKSLPKKMARKTLTSTKVVNNAKKKYQNMIVQRRLNLRKLDNSSSITNSNENVWPNAGASKISLHAPDTQRFVISLGSDSDSESEDERNEPVPVAEKHQMPQEIPADFEKNLNKFLRDVRTEQEQSAAAAKSSSSATQATKQDVPSTDKGPSNMHTPLAVRHLPVSQQEEYRRLKQQILEREKLKLQRKVASNNSNSNGSSSSNKLLNADVASLPVKSLPLCEKKMLIKQNQDKLKTPEKNSQELSIEVRRKSDDLARGTSESNVCRISADKKLSANIAKHTNFTHLQTKSNKKAIPNNLSIRISNVTAPSSTGASTRTVEDREKQSAKDKQQHRSALRALSKEEINRKCVQVLLKPDTVERVVTISDKSALQHDTIISVDQNKNPAEPDDNTEIINEKNLNNVDDNNTSNFSNASTVKLFNLSVNSSDSRHEDTMETTVMLSQCEAERQREIDRNTSTSVLTENNNSNNASRQSDTIADDNNGNASDVWDTLKKDVKAELESLTSLSKLEQERYLRETENKLVTRRYMVLDHLAEMSGNLRQWDMEKDVQIILASEVRKLKEQLKIAEEKLQQQRDRVSSMGPKVSTARQKINAGRRECFKLSRICSTLGNRLMGKNYKLPEAVAQLLSDKLKEIANHTRQITKKKRFQSNDISENSYSSLLQETSELSRYTCTEENLSLQEQPTNNANVIDEAGSKSDISHSTQSNEDKSLSILETLLDFSQTVPFQSTPEKREETSVNPSEHRNEEQMIFLNQDSASSSEPKLYQSNPTEQNNKHTEESRTVESDPAASSELMSSAMDSSNQEYNEQNNKRVSPQLPSPSPSASPSSPSPSLSPPPSPSPSPSPLRSRLPSPTTMTTDTTTTNTTMTTTTTTTTTRTTKTIAPYVSILMHLKKPRNINPHGILCPYELMGICRDEDCQYIHQSRNQI